MTDLPDPGRSTPLERRLGLADAVTIGAGSMIGAGVFSAWGPAADAAGTGLLVGLVVAAGVAFCNATSSAQLAAVHPESGGTYVYARRQLGPFWGHLAGWGFVVGKIASCVAVALTAGAYLWPDHGRLVGVAAVGAVAVVNIGGLTRTVLVTKCLLAIALMALAAVAVAGWSNPGSSLAAPHPDRHLAVPGVLRSAGFLFFAFAGYARIATLGEEVRDPDPIIPKAIPRALAGVLVIYTVVGVTLLATVPIDAVAASDAPLNLVVSASRFERLTPIVQDRRRHRRARRTPQSRARRLPHRPRDGPAKGTAELAVDDRRTPLTARARRGRRDRRRDRAHRDAGPSRRDRLLRRHHPHLLRDHQRRLPDSAPESTTLAPLDQRGRHSPAASPSRSCSPSPRSSPAPPSSSPASLSADWLRRPVVRRRRSPRGARR